MDIYNEFFKIVRLLNSQDIRYAAVGGIAMAFHDIPRFTKDIDILVLPEEIDEDRNGLARLGYFESASPWTFDSANVALHRFMKTLGSEHITVDILVGNDDSHRAVIAAAVSAESDEGLIQVANRKDMIWMKQSRNSDQDQVDIARLKDDQDREDS